MAVWFAFSQKVSVHLQIFRFSDLAAPHNNRDGPRYRHIGRGYSESVRLGDNLHIVLAVARPNASSMSGSSSGNSIKANYAAGGSFPLDELLAYDVEVSPLDASGSGSSVRSLKDVVRQFNSDDDISYSEHQHCLLPTFFIPSADGDSHLNMLYASCRKLHGKGADSLVAADKIIRDNFSDPHRRPAALFLTGDQIYADDVADPLIEYISKLGNKLLGWNEAIHGLDKPLSAFRMGERRPVVERDARFTTPNAGNHLLGFGEFAAMYLMAWNIDNWPRSFPEAKEGTSWSRRRKYENQVRQLQEELKALPKIRRVLANVPTYMICDDHEITDDWNITEEWVGSVGRSKIGNQVLANGLAAYWAFQAWGNNPDQFDNGFISGITNYLETRGKGTAEERQTFEHKMLSYGRWSYATPFKPATIVLDSRTQRQYDSFAGPPQLAGDVALASLLDLAKKSGYRRGQPIFIVTPTPVFGFNYAEKIQQFLAKRTGVYKLDLETWSADVRGWIKLLSFLAKELAPSTCVFLSGDVHYAFTVRASFHLLRRDGTAYDRMNIVQLNSSALKTTSLVKIAMLSELLGRLRQISPTKFHIKMGWDRRGSNEQSPAYMSSSLSMTRSDKSIVRKRANRKTLDMLKRYSRPEWIISTSMINQSGDLLPLLVISDNNLGMATIEQNRSGAVLSSIEHRLYVRKKRARHYDKVHRAHVDVNDAELPAGLQDILNDNKRNRTALTQ